MTGVGSSRLSNRIAVGAAALSLVLFALIGGATSVAMYDLVRRSVEAHLHTAALRIADQVEATLNGVLHEATDLAGNTIVASALVDAHGREAYLKPFLAERHSAFPVRYTLADFRGATIAGDADMLVRESGLTAWAAGVVLSGQPAAHLGSDASLLVAVPVIYRVTGQPEGVMVARVDLGVLTAGRAHGMEAQPLAVSLTSGAPQRAQTDAIQSVTVPLQLEGAAAELNLTLTVSEGANDVLGEFSVFTRVYVVLAVFVVVAVVLGALLMGRRLAAPLERLSLAALAAANDPVRAPELAVTGFREVEALVSALNGLLGRFRVVGQGLEHQVDQRTADLYREVAERRSAEGRLQLVLDSVGEGICWLDRGGAIVFANKAAAHLLGCAVEDLTHRDNAIFGHHVADGQPCSHETCLVHHTLADGVARSCSVDQFSRRDGTLFPVEYVITPAGTDAAVGGVLVFRDITARIETETVIRNSRARLQAILDNAPVGLAIIRPDRRIVLANPRFCDIYRTDAASLTGKSAEVLYSTHEEFLRVGDMSYPVVMRGEIFQAVMTMQRHDGTAFWAGMTSRLINPDNPQEGLVWAIEDVSERKAFEAALIEARKQAEAATWAKSAFLANMSHEIRTPMNAIIGLTHLLEQGELPQRQRDYLSKIKGAARSLLGILNDILDLSKIEAGRLELEHIDFSLEEVLRNIATIVSTNAQDKGVETVVSVDPATPLDLVGDPMRLQQVLINLGGNAVKFTEAGEVVIAVRPLAVRDGQVDLEFSIRDTGIGISPEQRVRLFQAFSQADSSTTRRFGGTGLGLAICARLVTAMGGGIDVDSEPGKGSEFRFVLPFDIGEARQARPVEHFEDLRGLRVLVVDDNATARQVLAEMCRAAGWRAEVAASGAEAITSLRSLKASGGECDVVFVDWQMPDLDGIDTVRRISADPSAAQPAVVLMVTAFGQEEALRAAQGLRINGVLCKPMTPSSMLDAVSCGRLNRPLALPKAEPSLTANRLAGLSVLLVEDNEINQLVARDILSLAGATVEVAGNGSEAVDRLVATPEAFDVVLMDIQMPVMDGYEATGIIRNRLGLTALPIFAMTANAMQSDREQSMAAGMNGHLSKPIDAEGLVRLLSGQETRRAPLATALPPTPTPSSPAASVGTDLPGFKMRDALIRLGGNHDLFVSLVAKFEAANRGFMEELRRLLALGEHEQAARACHSLRGVAANLGAFAVGKAASAVEAALKDGHLESVDALVATLEADLIVALESARAIAAVTVAPTEALLPSAERDEALARLKHCLAHSDLAALDAFAALRPTLAAMDGASAAVATCAAALDGLDFAGAAVALSEIEAGL